jgi:hypothetical protein
MKKTFGRAERVATLAVLGFLAATAVRAQDMTVALDPGLAVGSGGGGVTLGGSLRFDFGERLGLEVSGAYLDRERHESGASGLASLLVNLAPAKDKAVPYLAIGGGVYRTRFEGMNGRFDLAGMSGPWQGAEIEELWRYMGQLMGSWATPGMMRGRGGSWDWQDLMDGRFDGSSTDAALTVGGGIRIDLGHNLSLTPDARALLVFRDGDTKTLGTFKLSVGYRF